MPRGCEYSLYCKRGRENTGVSLYREKKTALLTHSLSPLTWTLTRAHTPQLSSHGNVSQTHTLARNGKPKQRNKNTKIFGFFSTALSFTGRIPSFRVVH